MKIFDVSNVETTEIETKTKTKILRNEICQNSINSIRLQIHFKFIMINQKESMKKKTIKNHSKINNKNRKKNNDVDDNEMSKIENKNH